MTLVLNKIDDPRDNLEKARRMELYRFAKEHGLDVTEEMPAILIRYELRRRGLTNIKIPVRILGAQNQGQAIGPAVQPQRRQRLGGEEEGSEIIEGVSSC